MRQQVWSIDHGYGWICTVDPDDRDAPLLVEWQDGTAGWHGLEVLRAPERRTLTLKDGELWAGPRQLFPGHFVVAKLGRRRVCQVIEQDGRWLLEAGSTVVPVEAGSVVWC